MIHTLNNQEVAYGYIQNTNVFPPSTFPCGKAFAGVTFHYASGSVVSYATHNKGPVHMHNSVPGRLDGLTAGFSDPGFVARGSRVVDVWYDPKTNVVHIEEIAPNGNVDPEIYRSIQKRLEDGTL